MNERTSRGHGNGHEHSPKVAHGTELSPLQQKHQQQAIPSPSTPSAHTLLCCSPQTSGKMRVGYCDDAAACWRVACQVGGWWLVATISLHLCGLRSTNPPTVTTRTTTSTPFTSFRSMQGPTRLALLTLPSHSPRGSRVAFQAAAHTASHTNTHGAASSPLQYCELALNLSSFQFVSLSLNLSFSLCPAIATRTPVLKSP